MKMKAMRNTLLTLLLVFATALSLTGCSTSFDAKGYTQSFLDVIAKEEYTQYAKLTDSSEDDAKNERESLLEGSVSSLLTNVTVSDDTKQKISDMFNTIYKKWNYEVQDAQKNDDGSYTVPVKVKKLNAFSDAFTTTYKRVQDRVKTIDDSKEQEYYDLFYATFAEAVQETAKSDSYGDTATIDVKVSPSEKDKNVYELEEDSISALFDGLMDMDALEKEASSFSANTAE